MIFMGCPWDVDGIDIKYHNHNEVNGSFNCICRIKLQPVIVIVL